MLPNVDGVYYVASTHERLTLKNLQMIERDTKPQNKEAMQYDTVLGNVDLKTNLKEIGFEDIESGWYENKEYQIRLRLWKDCEIDFWLHRSSVDEDDNELRFRGKIYKFSDVRWVLDRCFGYVA